MRSRAGPAPLGIEVGMRGDEGRLLASGADDMPSMKWWPLRSTWVSPSSDDEAEVLLHADARLVVRSSADMKYARLPGLGVELRDPGGIEDRLVEALAVLAGDAGVAERAAPPGTTPARRRIRRSSSGFFRASAATGRRQRHLRA